MKCDQCEDEENKVQMMPAIQQSADGKAHASPALSSRLNSSKGKGQPLPDNTRSFMESGFGADFSQVNVHHDIKAAEMSDSIGAKAFTHGNDIYFNKGQYNPGTASGKHLLAHELTHTIQQKSGRKIQRNGGHVYMYHLYSGNGKKSAGITDDQIKTTKEYKDYLVYWKSKGMDEATALDACRRILQKFDQGIRGREANYIASGREAIAAKGAAPVAPAPVPDPNISSWTTKNTGTTAADNCCAICPVDLGVDCHPVKFKNGIELKAVIADHVAGFSYDIKRTKEGKSWRRNGAADPWTNTVTRAAGSDDDARDSDECLVPIASGGNHHIYSEDRPGFKANAASGAYTDKVQVRNFIEFVRITKPDGTTYDDPLKQNWHSKVWLKKTGGVWDIDAAKSKIDAGHLASFNP